MYRSFFLTLLLIMVLPATSSAKNKEKEYFNLLAQYRQDIPAAVIKQVKKDMGYFDSSYPRIHDGWIEHPFGKSVDLQGNELFPEIDYNRCKPVSPTHFELSKYHFGDNKCGVVRTDGQVIVPMENLKLSYYPLYNLIVAQVDWDPYENNRPRKGQVKIYNYYGDLLHTVDNVSSINPYDLAITCGYTGKLILTTDEGSKELNFSRQRTHYQQDQITKFFSEGPQAATYNIIRDLCASEKKGDQKKAMDLLNYYMFYILPNDNYAGKHSSVSWDATLRYLACVNFTKDYKRLDWSDEYSRPVPYQYLYYPNAVEPQLAMVNNELPQVVELASQVEPLLFLAVNEYERKMVRDAQRAQTWLAVLGVLANSLNSTGGYTPVAESKSTSVQTATVPQINTGKSYLEQTSISPEIVGMAMTAGWVPETPSTSTSTSTSTPTSSSSSSTKRICHACFGKGTHQVCNGTGIQLAFGNKRTEKCSGCHGTGKCPHCNGGYYD